MTAPQRLRLGMALFVVAIVLWLAWRAGAALVPFALGGLLAYLLTPLVQRMGRITSHGAGPQKRWARPVSILSIYILVGGALAGLGFLLAPIIANSIQDLIDGREELIEGVQREFESVLAFYRDRVPEEMQVQIDGWAEGLLSEVGSLAASVAQGTFGFTFQSLSVMLGFLVIPIWLFLFMKDQPRFAAWFYGLFPSWIRPDARQVVSGASHVLGAYIRAQLILSVILGVTTYIGLLLLDVPFAIPLAIVAAFSEFIPILGPIIAGAVALLVVLAVEPGWLLLWVLLLYLGIQQVENYVLVPRIQGRAMEVHPALVILLVVILGQIFGLLGVLLAVPGYAALRNTYVYIYRRLGEGDRHPASFEKPPIPAIADERELVPMEQAPTTARSGPHDREGEPA